MGATRLRCRTTSSRSFHTPSSPACQITHICTVPPFGGRNLDNDNRIANGRTLNPTEANMPKLAQTPPQRPTIENPRPHMKIRSWDMSVICSHALKARLTPLLPFRLPFVLLAARHPLAALVLFWVVSVILIQSTDSPFLHHKYYN